MSDSKFLIKGGSLQNGLVILENGERDFPDSTVLVKNINASWIAFVHGEISLKINQAIKLFFQKCLANHKPWFYTLASEKSITPSLSGVRQTEKNSWSFVHTCNGLWLKQKDELISFWKYMGQSIQEWTK